MPAAAAPAAAVAGTPRCRARAPRRRRGCTPPARARSHLRNRPRVHTLAQAPFTMRIRGTCQPGTTRRGCRAAGTRAGRRARRAPAGAAHRQHAAHPAWPIGSTLRTQRGPCKRTAMQSGTVQQRLNDIQHASAYSAQESVRLCLWPGAAVPLQCTASLSSEASADPSSPSAAPHTAPCAD
jgi:hypothetical protein